MLSYDVQLSQTYSQPILEAELVFQAGLVLVHPHHSKLMATCNYVYCSTDSTLYNCLEITH